MEEIQPSIPRNLPADFGITEPLDSHAEGKVCSLFLFVVSFGAGNDWAAYYGPPSWTPERVAKYGDKLPRDAALAMFPNVRRHYRS